MKRIITVAMVSLVAAGVMTGCVFAPPAHAPETPPPTTEQSSAETSNPPETTEPTETQTKPAEPDWEAIDEAYLTVVRGEIDWTNNVSDEELIGLAQEVCNTVGDLGFEETIYALAMDGTLTEQEMQDLGFIVGAATAAYCPEYL